MSALESLQIHKKDEASFQSRIFPAGNYTFFLKIRVLKEYFNNYMTNICKIGKTIDINKTLTIISSM